MPVIGLDAAAALLDRARRLAVGLHTQVRWIRGDMRRLPFRSACAHAAVVMDAFGFFDTEEENGEVLLEVGRLLAPGGRLGLKVVNGGPVLAHFREKDREERDGTVVSVSRTLALDPPRMTERISISGSRGPGEYERHQRLYRFEDVRIALEHAGFAVINAFALPDGTPFDPMASPTMWIVGQLKAES